MCRELRKGPLVSALRQDECLVLFPVNPVALATYRQAFTPRHAKDAPTDAALPLERVLTQRDTRHPLTPQSAARRALAPLVAHRRGVVGDTGRLTNRLTHTLKHDLPHVLDWFDDQDTTRVCDFLAPWPTLQAAQLARRATLARCFRNPHGRSAAVIAQRIQAITSATPLTTAEGVSAPPALRGQALVSQRRVPLQARHHQDLDEGGGDVYLPEALARKAPKALRETGWPWVFPARERSLDPRSARERRHHGRESGLQQAVKRAAQPAGIDQKTGCHTLRHRCATPMLEHGVTIRVLQARLGHADVKTTERYPHVMAQDIWPWQSPLDRLSPDGSDQG